MNEQIKQGFKDKIRAYYPVSVATLDELLDIATVVSLQKNEIFLQQGFVRREFCYLHHGFMVANTSDEAGHVYNKNIFVANDWVGSTVSNILNKPSQFTIKAVTDCVLLCLPYSKWRSLIFEREDLKLFYIHYLEQHWVIEKERREVSLVLEDAQLRYTKLLQQHPGIEEHVSLQDIASHLGITPTQLSRIRKQKK